MKVSCLCYNRDFLAGLYHDSHNSHYWHPQNSISLFQPFCSNLTSSDENDIGCEDVEDDEDVDDVEPRTEEDDDAESSDLVSCVDWHYRVISRFE